MSFHSHYPSEQAHLYADAAGLSRTSPWILPLREQMKLWDEMLEERLNTVLPLAMDRAGVDLWLVVTSENNEDPLTRSLLPAALFEPRGKMLLVFVRTPEGVKRLSLSRPASIEHLYDNPWYGIGPGFDWKGHQIQAPSITQWACLRQVVEQYRPRTIAINRDEGAPVANGLRATDEKRILEALGEEWAGALVSAQAVATTWMETRTPREMSVFVTAAQIAHAIIDEAFSSRMIIPYVTTNDDVRFYMMQRVLELGLTPTFECTVAVFRKGLPGMHNNPIVIEPGDVIHCDFGLRYMNLCTDAQELGYVLRPGEEDAPEGLKRALAEGNRLQDIVMGCMAPGKSGNQILREAREQAIGEGLKPTVYCHPLGYHPHAAGTVIGNFGNQGGSPAGEVPFSDNTAHALELNAKVDIPEWDGQELMCCLEAEILFREGRALYMNAQQRRFHLVK